MALPDDDEPEVVRGEAGIIQGFVHDLVGHRLGRQVTPAHVGHARAENGDVVAAHAALLQQSGRRQSAGEGRACSGAEVLDGRVSRPP